MSFVPDHVDHLIHVFLTFLMGFGYLRGVEIEKGSEKGAEILDAVTHIYGSDNETKELKAKAALELAKALFKNNLNNLTCLFRL